MSATKSRLIPAAITILALLMGRLQEVAAAPEARSHPLLANNADLSTARTEWLGNALNEILQFILVSTPIDLL
jgi:hypothetical protein